MSIHILGLGSIGTLSAHLLRTANPLLRIYSLTRQTSAPVIYTVCDSTGVESQVSDIIDDTGRTTPIDILLITTKAHHTRIALEPYAKRITESTLSIFLQNGIGAVDSVRDILCTARVVLGTTTQGVERIRPDLVQWRFKGESLFSPEPPTILSSQESDVLAALGQIISFSALKARLYQKLALNACINPVTAIYHVQNGSVADPSSPAHELAICLSNEIQRVYATCKPELDVSRLSEDVMRLAKDSGRNTSSMLADVLAGRETEIDFINGQIVKMGKRMGLDVRENELVVQRIKDLIST
jgi:2-dehydropantoate 2-reductase